MIVRKKMVSNCNGSGGRGGSVNRALAFIKVVFMPSFRLTYVLFVATWTICNVRCLEL